MRKERATTLISSLLLIFPSITVLFIFSSFPTSYDLISRASNLMANLATCYFYFSFSLFCIFKSSSLYDATSFLTLKQGHKTRSQMRYCCIVLLQQFCSKCSCRGVKMQFIQLRYLSNVSALLLDILILNPMLLNFVFPHSV